MLKRLLFFVMLFISAPVLIPLDIIYWIITGKKYIVLDRTIGKLID